MTDQIETPEDGSHILPEGCKTLEDALRLCEKEIIRRALKWAGPGNLTPAAERLGISYQGLAQMINARHPDLLPLRSPVIPRKRSVMRKEAEAHR